MEERHFQGSVKLYVLVLYAFQKNKLHFYFFSHEYLKFLSFLSTFSNKPKLPIYCLSWYYRESRLQIVLDKTVEYNVIPTNCYW